MPVMERIGFAVSCIALSVVAVPVLVAAVTAPHTPPAAADEPWRPAAPGRLLPYERPQVPAAIPGHPASGPGLLYRQR